MELHQTAEFIEASLATYQDSHRLNGISELMALADYCTKHNLKTELISKEKHDSFIDPENALGAWVLRRKGGTRLKITSESGEVIFTLRIEDNIWKVMQIMLLTGRHSLITQKLYCGSHLKSQ